VARVRLAPPPGCGAAWGCRDAGGSVQVERTAGEWVWGVGRPREAAVGRAATGRGSQGAWGVGMPTRRSVGGRSGAGPAGGARCPGRSAGWGDVGSMHRRARGHADVGVGRLWDSRACGGWWARADGRLCGGRGGRPGVCREWAVPTGEVAGRRAGVPICSAPGWIGPGACGALLAHSSAGGFGPIRNARLVVPNH